MILSETWIDEKGWKKFKEYASEGTMSKKEGRWMK